MGSILINSIRFVLFVLLQVMVLNQLGLGLGAYPMLYPLFLLLLPFEMTTVPLMFIAFAIGFAVDMYSNTFGLHASSALIFAYFRPIVFKLFAPRDGYDGMEESTVYAMGRRWFFYVFGSLLLIHHGWFFFIESFKMNDWLLVLRKIALSVPLSFLLSLLVQFIFVSRKKSER